jgi:hypothetical protein
LTELPREEIEGLEIEISVLSRLILMRDPSTLEVGRQGARVSCDGHAGVLLPQLAENRPFVPEPEDPMLTADEIRVADFLEHDGRRVLRETSNP